MSSQSRWKSLAFLATVLVAGVVGLCLLVGKMRERKEFVGKVTGGYRCHFTLSPDWKPKHFSFPTLPGRLEQYDFTTSPSPVREWITVHLLHQPPSTGNPSVSPPRLYLITAPKKSFLSFLLTREGYPDLPVRPGETRLGERHLWIDDCPATVIRYEASNGTPGIAHVTNLCVCMPDYSYVYVLVGSTLRSKTDVRYHDQIDLEMQAIIASFHVEKVTGGKQGIRP